MSEKENNQMNNSSGSDAIENNLEKLVNNIANNDGDEKLRNESAEKLSSILDSKESDNGLTKDDIIGFIKKPENVALLTKLVGEKYSNVVTKFVGYAAALGVSTKEGGLSKILEVAGKDILKDFDQKGSGIFDALVSKVKTMFSVDSSVETGKTKDSDVTKDL